ncbi:hypothetical protein MKX03_037566 [Papaver bracteatum]|nr:hypothetical protein MKX03_037566 [Papaver bracteatum]
MLSLFAEENVQLLFHLSPRLAMWQTLHKYLPFQVPDIKIKHLVAASVAFKGIGGVLFISGSSLGAYLLLLHQLAASRVFHAICNTSLAKIDFVIAVFDALLFFLGMKNSSPKRQPAKKKCPKAKTT